MQIDEHDKEYGVCFHVTKKEAVQLTGALVGLAGALSLSKNIHPVPHVAAMFFIASESVADFATVLHERVDAASNDDAQIEVVLNVSIAIALEITDPCKSMSWYPKMLGGRAANKLRFHESDEIGKGHNVG